MLSRFSPRAQTGEKLFLVLEYCDGGDLEAYRQAHGGARNRLPEAVARDFTRQLGMSVCCSQSILLVPLFLFINYYCYYYCTSITRTMF
jgi:serine/threonine protein kinase